MTRTLSIFACCCVTAACAQQPVVLLDPARGGSESGAHIADRTAEKQVTLDLAGRLASLLRARGFTVAMTRDTDIDLTNDARAAMANNLHPIACILLHATPVGSGVHVYTTALHQKMTASGSPVRWDEAQAAYTERSSALAADVKAALQHAKLTASTGQTWMHPLDNMQCPALAVEVAPEKDGTGAEDSAYQAKISNALANTLLQWRGKVAGMAPPEPQAAPPPVALTKPASAIAVGGTPRVATAAKPAADAFGNTPAKSAPTPKPARPPSRLPALEPLAPDRTQP